MEKEKTVFLVRKEAPFPDKKIFRKFNKIYWYFILNFIILKKIKEYEKKENFMVICDLDSYDKIKEKCRDVKLFDDFIIIPKICKDPYEETIKLAYKFAEDFKEIFMFENHNIIDYISEELAYDLVDYIEEFNLIQEISKKEKVKQFLIIGEEQAYSRIAPIVRNTKRISSINLSDILINIKKFLRKYSLQTRKLFPIFFNNREFIKQNKNMNDGEEKKILFAGFDISDIERMMPLIELTKKKRKKFIILTNYKDSKEFLYKNNLPYIFFGDFLNKKDKKIIWKKKKELIKEWKKIKGSGKLFYKGVNLWKAVESEIEYRFFTRAPWTMHYIKASQKLLKNVSIIINEGDLSPRCRSLVEVGKKYKIPSLFLQEGARIIKDSPRGFYPLISDKIAGWGQSIKEYLEDLGIEKERIVITGCSKFDSYLKKKPIDQNIYSVLKMKKNQKFFILASLGPPEWGYFINKEKEKIIRETSRIMKYFPGVKLVIKLHPRESWEDVKRIVNDLKEEEKKRIRIIRDFKAEELIRASELVINVRSTIGVEALLLGKPVIQMDIFNHWPMIKEYSKFNASIIVKNKEQLINAIKKVLAKDYLKEYEKSREKFMKWYLYKMDGRASERIINLIEDMIK